MSTLSETAKRPESPSSDSIARKWLVIFAEMFDVDLTQRARMVEIWCRALSDLPPAVLGRACERTVRTTRFFPKPGEIRVHVDEADAAGLQVEAERAWEIALEYARQWDGSRHAPGLPGKIERVVRCAGGLHWLEGCPESELQWARKRFIEAFSRADELERSGELLTRGDARSILRELAASGDAPKSLAAPAPERSEGPPSLVPLRDVFAEVAAQIPPPEKPVETDDGIRREYVVVRDDRRVAELKRQAEQLSRGAGS